MKRGELGQQISNAIETVVFRGTELVPFVRPDVADVMRRINTLSNNTLDLRQPPDVFDGRVLLSTLDQVAKDYVRSAQVVATGSGGATGLLGLPGMVLDLPILVASTVGMVRRHALVYGFTDIEESHGDRIPLLLAFGAALGADRAISQVAIKVGSGIAGETAERLLARLVSQEMASKIATRLLARAVPMVSSATGAALDYLFLREAGRQSIRHYRQRHMLVRHQMEAARTAALEVDPYTGASAARQAD